MNKNRSEKEEKKNEKQGEVRSDSGGGGDHHLIDTSHQTLPMGALGCLHAAPVRVAICPDLSCLELTGPTRFWRKVVVFLFFCMGMVDLNKRYLV